MTLKELELKLELRNLTPELQTQVHGAIKGGYASDLLSDVLAHAPPGGVLVTIQVHLNVIAVAVHAELAAVIFSSNRLPDEEVRQRAVAEEIVLYVSPQSTFDIVGGLSRLGIRGGGR